MHRITHKTLATGLVLALTLPIWACGGDDDGESGDTSNGTATSNSTSNGTTGTSNGTTGTSNGTTSNGTTATSNGTTGTSNGTTGTSNGTTATSNGTTGGSVCDEADASDTVLEAGEYFVAARLAGLGLNVFFQINMVAADDRLITFELKALSADKSFVSDPLITVCDTPITDGAFTIALGSFVMPGAATPTGTDVELVDVVFEGQLLDTTTACGTVGGMLPLLGIDLAGTTFKAVPFGTETAPPEDSCESTGPTLYDPIETCPALAAGANTMVSAELDREFTIYAPTNMDPEAALPVVFLHHGLGGDGEGIVDGTGFDDLVDEGNFLLVVPEGANNADGGRVFATEWNWIQPLFDTDNQDLVFFDDMVTCLGENYTIDANKIYATGMSAGGLWTTFLTINRGDVLAATAPFSGGYVHSYPDDYATIPVMFSWGGENDIAVDTNFDDLAKAATGAMAENGHYLVVCDHGQEHIWPSELTMPAWMMLSNVTKGDDDAPFVDTLPDAFPDYCTIGIASE